MFMTIRGWIRIAMGIALLIVGLVSSTVHAQPVRSPRDRGAQRGAQAPSIAPSDCSDRAGSNEIAAQARGAFRTRDYALAETLWSTAIALCGLPDRYEGRARTREARQGQLPDGPERLTLLDGAVEDYNQAVARATLVEGFRTASIEAGLRELQGTREQLAQRLQQHGTPVTVRPTPVVAHPTPACTANLQTDLNNCGRCGNACATGQICRAGTCRAQQDTNPPIPTTPSRALAHSLLIGGSVATLTGFVMGGIGVAANADADRLCQTTTNTPRCLVATSGDPRDYTSWTVPGFVVGGLGTAAAIIGLVLELRHPGTTPRTATAAIIPTHNGAAIVGTF